MLETELSSSWLNKSLIPTLDDPYSSWVLTMNSQFEERCFNTTEVNGCELDNLIIRQSEPVINLFHDTAGRLDIDMSSLIMFVITGHWPWNPNLGNGAFWKATKQDVKNTLDHKEIYRSTPRWWIKKTASFVRFPLAWHRVVWLANSFRVILISLLNLKTMNRMYEFREKNP